MARAGAARWVAGAACAALACGLCTFEEIGALNRRTYFTGVNEAGEAVAEKPVHLLGNDSFLPQQLHLAPTTDPSRVKITYVTSEATFINGSVTLIPLTTGGNPVTFPTTDTTYDVGIFGWHGWIHTAEVTGLQPATLYNYTVGYGGFVTGPVTFRTAVAAAPDTPVYVLVTGDQGTFMPFGFLTSDAMEREFAVEPFDLSVLVGDVAYAGIGSQQDGELSWIWDVYGVQTEPYASQRPFVTTVGNHESYYNYTAFTHRYYMPGNETGGNGNFWFSFDFGPIHFTSISSEHPYTPGSPQYAWIQADLAAAAGRRSITPWLIAMLHRPVYCSDQDEYNSHCPGALLAVTLEPLFRQAAVDVVLTGPIHMYERTHAIYNGTVVTPAGPNNTYASPGAPIYITQGTSGAVQDETYIEPQPVWSAFRTQAYGYARMKVQSPHSLTYEYVDVNGTLQDSWSITK